MSARSYEEAARAAAVVALAEDLAGYGDITGAAFRGDGLARVVAREAGTVMLVVGGEPGAVFKPSDWDTGPLPG